MNPTNVGKFKNKFNLFMYFEVLTLIQIMSHKKA